LEERYLVDVHEAHSRRHRKPQAKLEQKPSRNWAAAVNRIADMPEREILLDRHSQYGKTTR
jgi:hypothetical protein